jgi:predicted phage terminase large subunit-like protein
LLIIDDPVASKEQADSEVSRSRVWNWYRTDAYSRLQPGGRVILVMTRWHEDDLGGRLLREMEQGGDQWDILKLEAICEAEDDPLGRQIGEALWPSWMPEKALLRIKNTVGEREWNALYMQRPQPAEGGMFRIDAVQTIDVLPTEQPNGVVRAWDLASTSGGGDYTVGLKLALYPGNRLILLDIVRLRGAPDAVERAIIGTAGRDGHEVLISLPEDPGQAGKHQSQYFIKQLMGFRVESTRETGSKEVRAGPVASQVNGGNLAIVRAGWNDAFLTEMASFPNAAHDDQIDALSRAFAVLMPDPLSIWMKLADDGPAPQSMPFDYYRARGLI